VQILSHRGLFRCPEEKNTLLAFRRAFEAGFGIETDVRDRQRTLVISHDPPDAAAPSFRELLALHREVGPQMPLAINVKSCGLAGAIGDLLREFGVASSFVFDMAVPDALEYVRVGVPAFTRASEVEPQPSFYEQARGVWIDCFHEDWITEDVVSRHLAAGKQVALVSPELHKRAHGQVWQRWAAMSCAASDALYICTDHPEAARQLFAGA
jgi:hypothetical protein